jgi:DNA invertase Pin-like site-specific DNA recombinase
MKAAQYVRMSTERQEYSIVNQMAAIAAYASARGFEVVRTYSDAAKSGLDLKRRPGLQALIDDVTGGRADYKAILVFDVSRWGRFQDTDEAACYEFLCKRAGIQVHYCAEPFSNDGSLSSTFLKLVKRTMAAEYLRELSAKVHAGQCRIAASGFKVGGRAGYGLRRLLLDSNHQPKTILRDGERKSLTTERVIYTPGPDDEVMIVRQIYSMFLEHDLKVGTIARLLNEQGLRYGAFGPWNHSSVSAILTHPKYTGCVAYNRKSGLLKSKRIRNPPDRWILSPDSFQAIVSKEVFESAQAKLRNLVYRRSNVRLLQELRDLLRVHGKLCGNLLRPANGMASVATYVARFGSLVKAYQLIGYNPPRYAVASIEDRRKLSSLKADVSGQFKQAFADAHLRCAPHGSLTSVRGCGLFDTTFGRCRKTFKGNLRWDVRTRQGCTRHHLIVVRLNLEQTSVKDFVVLKTAPRVVLYFTLTEAMARARGTVCATPAEVITAVLNLKRTVMRARVS